jgi:uracil-DNA glycosylase
VRVHEASRILIAGQAPGRLVHETGLPWNDPSGDRLRDWMQLDRETFYDVRNIAVAAMGFCYPGTVNGADLPPRRECAPLWRERLLAQLKRVRLTLLVGSYAQKWHLPEQGRQSMAQTLSRWRDLPENMMVLPHPSWRNNAWLRQNAWFAGEVLPVLRKRVKAALA